MSSSYRVITQQGNDMPCKYVCKAYGINETGQLRYDLLWENDIKPSDCHKVESLIRNVSVRIQHNFVYPYRHRIQRAPELCIGWKIRNPKYHTARAYINKAPNDREQVYLKISYKHVS